MKTTKGKYFKILDSIDTKNAHFHYCATCNEQQSHCKKQNKSARYAFYIITKEDEILVQEGYFHKTNHELKETELRKKYSKWGLEWKQLRGSKNKATSA